MDTATSNRREVWTGESTGSLMLWRLGLITCLNEPLFYQDYEMALHKGAWMFLLVDHGAVWNLHDYNSESLAWTNSASLVSETSCLNWISRGSIRAHSRIHPWTGKLSPFNVFWRSSSTVRPQATTYGTVFISYALAYTWTWSVFHLSRVAVR